VRDGDGAFTITAAPPLGAVVCAANIVRLRVGGSGAGREASYLDARTWPAVSGTVECDSASLVTDALMLRLHGDARHLELCGRQGKPHLRLELAAKTN